MLITEKPLLALCAADLMANEVVMIPRQMSLQGAARLLSRANVTGAPVVDDQGRCIGVLSASDFMHWAEHDERSRRSAAAPSVCSAWQLPEDERAGCTVGEFMTGDPVVIAPGTSIGEIARMMLDAHIHRVVVVDSERRPIGIVSTTDLLAAVHYAAQQEALPSDITMVY